MKGISKVTVPDRTTVRVLKNRWTGETGIACSLDYDHETGRLTETPYEEDDIPFEDESTQEWTGDSTTF